MQKNNSRYPIIVLAVIISITAVFCKKDPALTSNDKPIPSPTPYKFETPTYFPEPEFPADNPLTEEGVYLGRKLYYEPLLSKGGPNNGLSCSSCHSQKHGFTTLNHKPFEEFGVVMPHINMAWNNNFLWAGNVTGTLEDIMIFEVEKFFQANMTNFKSHPEYPKLFKKAFGDNEITTERASMAMAQFFRTLVSANSRFDKYLRKEEQLTQEELLGFTIFNTEKGDCFHCHGIVTFTDNLFHNIGLDSAYTGVDMGRYRVTENHSDLGKFKTPTLRNVAVRGGYMHDGRFKTLEEVVEHYNSGVLQSATLDPILTKPGKDNGLNLSPQEKAALVAFLKTLTDKEFLNDPRYAKP